MIFGPLAHRRDIMLLVRTVLITALAGIGATASTAEPKAGDFGSENIKVGSDTREYRLVVPKSVDLTKPAPLVIAFHGMLIDSKDVMPKYTRLNETAEKHKFLIAYPNAIDKSWGLLPDKIEKDLAFFDALLAKIRADYKVDSDSVYVLGMYHGR